MPNVITQRWKDQIPPLEELRTLKAQERKDVLALLVEDEAGLQEVLYLVQEAIKVCAQLDSGGEAAHNEANEKQAVARSMTRITGEGLADE